MEIYPTIITCAIIIFLVYNICVIKLFGVPKSLSESYYLWDKYKIKFLFPLMMAIEVSLLMPCWIVLSEGTNFQFLAFIGAASLLFVAVAPAFRDIKLEGRVHEIFAVISAIASIAWIFCVPPIIIGAIVIPIVSIILWLILRVLPGWSFKDDYVYYVEMIAFISTFISIVCYMALIYE